MITKSEDLYNIHLEDGRTLVILADKSCIAFNMKDISTFSTQVKAILDNDHNGLILKNTSNYNNCKYVIRLFFSSMPDGIEYSLVDINKVNTNRIGDVCASNNINKAYRVIKYHDKNYCLFAA